MSTGIPPVCILAGGRATRLGARARDTPKALIEVAGRPFVEHQLAQLAGHGLRRVVLCVGHLGERIEAALGRRFAGVEIDYSYDDPGLDGTLGAIRRAAPLLGPRFLVLYGDTYLELDYRSFLDGWDRSTRPAAMTVLHNEGRWERSNVVYADGLVSLYDKIRSSPAMRWVDYGLGGLTMEVLDAVPVSETDLAGLYHRLSVTGRLYGFEVGRRFHEIGTPATLAETDAYLRSPDAPAGVSRGPRDRR